jgi:hypothetical protein
MSREAARPTASPVTLIKENPLCLKIFRRAIVKKFLIMVSKG